MPDSSSVTLLLAFTGSLVLSFIMEGLLRPRPVAPWKRGWSPCFIHIGLWSVAFGLEMALFQRPWFAAINVLAIMVLLVVINNFKYAYLREPFIYPDFEYFTDAIRHPRLYLPFFGVGNALLGMAAYGGCLAAGLILEPTLDVGTGSILTVVAGFVMLGLALLGLAAYKPATVHFNAVQDLRHLGLLAALWRYRAYEQRKLALERHSPFTQGSFSNGTPLDHVDLPDIVMVQSESFFDVRRIYDGIRKDTLANYDGLRTQALRHGQLQVAAWGANTVRTEYAVLSGVPPAALGVHQYNPYRRLDSHRVTTVAQYLQRLGYRTVCIHPYFANFYRRNKTFPAMGFDVFLDINEFTDSERFGPYISDKAVADKVIEVLGESRDQPLFVYVITMENHGPLHWESVTPQEQHYWFNAPLPKGCQDLIAYTRHLANMDAMLAMLRQAMDASPRPTGLCVFGDHVPIMPKVYAALGKPDGTTDYLCWGNAAYRASRTGAGTISGAQVPASKLADHELALAFLRDMGIAPKWLPPSAVIVKRGQAAESR